MSDKPDKCPFCGRPKTNNPNGVVYGCGTMYHGKQPYRSDTCLANEEIMELETRVEKLTNALKFYETFASDCNKTDAAGNTARHMLATDHGQEARKALRTEENRDSQTGNEEEE